MKDNRHSLAVGTAAFSAAFFIFAAATISESVLSMRESKKSGFSIVPDNLRLVPESLAIHLEDELDEFPTSTMTNSKAWAEFEEQVSVYAEGLELLKNEKRVRSFVISGLYLISAIGMAYFSIRLKKYSANKDHERTP